MEVLFAGVQVAAFAEAVEWYERFFGRSADVVPHDHEVMWQVAGTGWLYVVVGDASAAGKAVLTISVSDLKAAVAELDERGISSGGIEAVGDAGHKARFSDPEGNVIALVQVSEGPG